MPEKELDRIIAEAIKESSAAGIKDIGKVMKLVMPRLKGSADGKLINQKVKELLERV